MKPININDLTPQELVHELDRYIVGQDKAKRTVAIALRNRVRRSRLEPELQREITPKNIIMIGSTGVGKTEIARRISRLSGAPFIKVEATKYTEVGYVGRDVESMIRDLMANAISMVRKELEEKVTSEAESHTEEALLDLLLPPTPQAETASKSDEAPKLEGDAALSSEQKVREKFRKMLRDGELNERMIELDEPKANHNQSPLNVEVFTTNMNMPEDLSMNLQNMFDNVMGGKKQKSRKVRVDKAKEILFQEQKEKLIDQDTVLEIARDRVQNHGIIFIDEIDKIAVREGRSHGGEVSREGVQRDILPIVEGSQVQTRYGMIDTTHILFIAAGAFNLSKPSDLIPELQGRFPLRVELESLTAESLERILSTPENSLIFQYTELLKTEGVELIFQPEAIKHLAAIAAEVNANTEDIGARRLHTVLETLLEEVSFEVEKFAGKEFVIDIPYVDQRLQDLSRNQDLSRYIL